MLSDLSGMSDCRARLVLLLKRQERPTTARQVTEERVNVSDKCPTNLVYMSRMTVRQSDNPTLCPQVAGGYFPRLAGPLARARKKS